MNMVEQVQVPIDFDQDQQAKMKEHEEAMIKKAEGAESVNDESNSTPEQQQQEAPTNDRPEWLPEKFDSVEALYQSYQELEKKQSSQQPKEAEDSPKEGETSEAEPVENVPESLNIDDMRQQYANDGSLSEDNYNQLEKAGISKEIVDSYIKGQEAQAQMLRTEVLNSVGGEETFNQMTEWAKTNLSEAEINAYNNSTSTGDAETAKLAVQGLYAKFTSANGVNPNLVGGQKSDSAGDRFESRAQITKAMSDPRYKTDPAYRKAVHDRLSRSDVLG